MLMKQGLRNAGITNDTYVGLCDLDASYFPSSTHHLTNPFRFQFDNSSKPNFSNLALHIYRLNKETGIFASGRLCGFGDKVCDFSGGSQVQRKQQRRLKKSFLVCVALGLSGACKNQLSAHMTLTKCVHVRLHSI